jgi:hypothetical protein
VRLRLLQEQPEVGGELNQLPLHGQEEGRRVRTAAALQGR